MKRARFSEEQIISVLKEAEAGAKVTELCRRHGISDATFYTWPASTAGWRYRKCAGWRKRTGGDRGGPGAGPSCVRMCSQKTATARREARDGGGSYDHTCLSQRRACGLIGITRRGFQRAPAEDRNHQLRQRLRELAEQRRRWGCPMLYLILRREGWRANHKRVERLYRAEGLSLRRRRWRKRLSHLRVVRERPGSRPIKPGPSISFTTV